MNHVRVTTTSGQEVDIPLEEVKRLFHAHHPHETNEHYQNRAYNNILEAAQKHGINGVENSEKDIKELMVYALKHNDADMIGEIIEWFVAEHTMKVGA